MPFPFVKELPKKVASFGLFFLNSDLPGYLCDIFPARKYISAATRKKRRRPPKNSCEEHLPEGYPGTQPPQKRPSRQRFRLPAESVYL